ncbi:MAG: LysM peptidoglycan-binding domain-containing protein [Polyangiales bacterium]
MTARRSFTSSVTRVLARGLSVALVAQSVVIAAHAAPAPIGRTLGAGVDGADAVDTSAAGDAKHHGLPRGTIKLGDDSGKAPDVPESVPDTHTVKKGDTLWDICDTSFQNPWQWPRVWSWNPEIVNPHWIYPGQVLRLKEGASTTGGSLSVGSDGSAGAPPTKGSRIGAELKPRLVPVGTVFLRNKAFLYDEDSVADGELIGSPSERMILSIYDQAYVKLTDEQAKALNAGDKLTAYNIERPISHGKRQLGKVVQILGTLRVDTVDRDQKLATVTIIDVADVIERGARVGAVERKIDVIPPSTNATDLRGVVLASVVPTELYGANQVVFIDQGSDAGLKAGNRLFVVQKGDKWRSGIGAVGTLSVAKVSLGDAPATGETVPSSDEKIDYPEEVVAELRVLRVRKGSATCVVTSSQHELEPGDSWVAKKGY